MLVVVLVSTRSATPGAPVPSAAAALEKEREKAVDRVISTRSGRHIAAVLVIPMTIECHCSDSRIEWN